MSTEPSPPERARTILARGGSAEVAGGPGEPAGWAMRRLTVAPAETGAAGRPVEVEVADAAPLPVPERIRARVRVVGTTPARPGDDALHVLATSVTLVDEVGVHHLDVDDLLGHAPDPLADVEATVLTDLETVHVAVLETLAFLVEPRLRLGLVRVWPYRLDRHGLVLRLERAGGHVDERLPFRHPLTSVRELPREMAALVARGQIRGSACRHRAPVAGVEPSLRATAAARRICDPRPGDPT